MAEYIEREAVLKIIGDNCPHDKCGYNTEEEMGAGAACYYIGKDVENIPAADVVPKSEVEQILNSYALQYGTVTDQQKVIDEAKQEAAREIFEEIERYVIKGISVGGEHLTLFNGKNYSELKKKYTESEKEK